MNTSAASLIASWYRKTHERILESVEDLSEEQLAWQPPFGTHSIAWNLWHLARWADHLQESVSRMTPELASRLGPTQQLWEADGLAERWGWTALSLGFEQTGTHMEAGSAAQLPLPRKDVLLEYVRRAFATADRAVGAIDDQQLYQADETSAQFNAAYHGEPAQAEGRVGDAVLTHLAHDNRHLGEIEALRGQQGLNGSATS